jgi:outer membrane protein
MFKKIVCSVVLIMSSMTGLSAAELKIGVVDSRLVFGKAPQVETINGKLQKLFADKLSELKSMADDLKKQDETLKRDALTMTEDQRIKASRDIQALQSNFQVKQKQFQEDRKRAEQKEIRVIEVIVKKAIDEIAAAEGFDLILRIEVALYATKAIDISDKVIAKISDPAG